MDELEHNAENYEEVIGKMSSLPINHNKKVIRIHKGKKVELIPVEDTETIFTPEGSPATKASNDIIVLADGTSFTGYEKISVCQTCKNMVNESNIKRCICGKTICISNKCGKVFGDKWYCSFKCVLLKALGLSRKL